MTGWAGSRPLKTANSSQSEGSTRASPGGSVSRSRRSVAGGAAGHGIVGMRERAAMLGGTLSAGPTSEGGYLVEAVLPLAATPAEKA